MTTKATPKRLENEFKQISSASICGCTVLLDNENDLKNWTILMQGPEQTPYEGGVFKLKFAFPDNYPFKAPEVKFLTTIYHPNIKTDTGEICQDVFASSWAPTLKVSDILEKLVSMLRQPSTSTPLEPEICNEYISNVNTFNQKAREFTQKYASA